MEIIRTFQSHQLLHLRKRNKHRRIFIFYWTFTTLNLLLLWFRLDGNRVVVSFEFPSLEFISYYIHPTRQKSPEGKKKLILTQHGARISYPEWINCLVCIAKGNIGTVWWELHGSLDGDSRSWRDIFIKSKTRKERLFRFSISKGKFILTLDIETQKLSGPSHI